MPGVKIRFCPRARATLIAFAESVGLAMKKLVIGIDEPGAGPFPQVIPEELLCDALFAG
jgi:hypothetical protein